MFVLASCRNITNVLLAKEAKSMDILIFSTAPCSAIYLQAAGLLGSRSDTRVISKPTEKTTGELVALMFKLPIQLFPMKASLPHARKTTFKPLPILQLLFSCNLVLPEFSCPSKLWARLVSATTLTKD